MCPPEGTPRVLRASSLAYMNDSMEFKLAAEETIRLCGNRHGTSLEQLLFYDTMYELYAACFSEASDSLSQWRAYGTTGKLQVALGFDPTKLSAIANRNSFSLVPCLYRGEEHEAALANIITQITMSYDNMVRMAEEQENNPSFLASHPANQANARGRRGRGHFAAVENIWRSPTSARTKAQIKSESFADEHEVRLIGPSGAIEKINQFQVPTPREPSRVKHYEKNRLLVPFLEFPLDVEGCEFPIVALRIGPVPHTDLVKRSVERWSYRLKDSAGGPLTFRYLPSKAPFRYW